MPLSTVVRLTHDRKPVFPPQCPCCGQSPTSTNTLRRAPAGPMGVFRGRLSVEVPCCRKYALRLRLRWTYWLVCLGVLFLALVVASLISGFPPDPAGAPMSSPLRGLAFWVTFGSVFVLLFVWDLYHPAPFDFTHSNGTVEYEFRSSSYASEFARLNNVELSDKVDTESEASG